MSAFAVVLVGEVLAAAPTRVGEPGDVPDLLMFSALVGWATPPIVAVINQPRWPTIARLAMTVAFCIGVAAATCALEGRLAADRWITSALIVATTAVVTYQTAWKRVATAIETATSRGQAPPAG